MNENVKNELRKLPQVDAFLARPALQQAVQEIGHYTVKEAVQTVLQDLRQQILAGENAVVPNGDELENIVLQRLQEVSQFHLQGLVNGTGTVLHTNLGRAVLSEKIMQQVVRTATQYTNLEYDLAAATRGSRYNHVEQLLCELTGAEAALVVNNNAAAVLLALTTVGKGKEVIISRGELVEIGGLFRIPDVLSFSGAILREVGTTNKTHLFDYERAFTDETGAIMKVHTSNYRIIGFTASPKLADLVRVSHEKHVPVLYDLGSGSLVALEHVGLSREPTIQEALQAGVDIVTCSGDKLLGGPQGGIILGKRKYIQVMKEEQLLRALRVDKMTLAALEGTLRLYQRGDAVKDVPTLCMLSLTAEDCKNKALELQAALQKVLPNWRIGIVPCNDVVGGGAYPDVMLPGYAVTCTTDTMTAEELKQRLHQTHPAVMGRIQEGKYMLSVRTILEEQYEDIGRAFVQITDTY